MKTLRCSLLSSQLRRVDGISNPLGKGGLLSLGWRFVSTYTCPSAKAPATPNSTLDSERSRDIGSLSAEVISMTAQLVAMQAKLIEAMTQMTRPAVLEKSQPIFSLSQHEATPSGATAKTITLDVSPQTTSSPGRVLESFARPHGVPCADNGEEVIHDIREVASYSWTDAERPTIVVPGFPPIWTEGHAPFDLQQNSRGNPCDMLKHNLLPAIAAARHGSQGIGKKDISFAQLDLVASRDILFRLALWVCPSDNAPSTSDFSINVERAGKTVLLSHPEGEPVALSDLARLGCDKTVQRAMTSQAKGLTGFYRVIAYSLGGLKLLVECGTDACLVDDGGRHKAAMLEWERNQVQRIREAALTALPGGLRVVPAGIDVKHKRTVKLQAVARIGDKLALRVWLTTFMQMRLGHTHQHVVGAQLRSTSQPTSRATLDKLEKQHAEANTRSVTKLFSLAAMLPGLCAAIRKQPEGKLMRLVCQTGKLTLETREADAVPALPKIFLKLFR